MPDVDFPNVIRPVCLPEDGEMPSSSTPIEADPVPGGSVSLEDVPSQRRAAWGRDEASTVTTPTEEVVTAPQDNAEYWALVAEIPKIQNQGEIESEEDPNNDPEMKFVPLEELLTRYVGEERSYTYGIRGGAGLDEGLTLANLFNELEENFGDSPVKVIVRARNPADPIYLNRVATLYSSNKFVEFRSPIVYGASGALRMFGDQPEVLRGVGKTAKAKLRSQATAGHSVLHLSSSDSAAMTATNFLQGDVIILRGQNDIAGKALTKQVVHVLSADTINNDLYLFEELETTFEVTYPDSDWPPDITTGTTIALADYAALTVQGDPNDVTVRVNRTQLESGSIAAGSIVQLSTNETEADINFNAHSTSPTTTSTSSLLIGTGSKSFVVVSASGFTVGMYIRAANSSTDYMAGVITGIVGTTITVSVSATLGAGTFASWTLVKPYRNTARLEIKKVLSIAVVDADESDVTFDSPILDTYATSKFAGITLYTPIVNSVFRGVRATYSATQLSRNTHGLQIGYGYNCKIVDCEIDGSGGQLGNAFRVSNSLECEVNRCRALDPAEIDSSEGYLFAVYVSDRTKVLNCFASGGRHNYLMQKANNTFVGFCASINDAISGFDVHGVRSFNTHFFNCYGVGGVNLSSDATHKSIFRVGNTSHACGDFGTVISGCFIHGAVLSGLIDTYAALEIFGASEDITFIGNYITDAQCGIRAGFDNGANDDIGNLYHADNVWVRIDTLYDDQSGPTIDIQDDGPQQVNGATTADISLTTTLPIGTSAPAITDGTEVISTTYTAKQPSRRVKLTFCIPTMEISTTGPVAAAIFVDGVFAFGGVHRVTSGGTPPDGLTVIGTFLSTGASQTISVRVGPHSASTVTLNPAGNDWGDHVNPYLIIE